MYVSYLARKDQAILNRLVIGHSCLTHIHLRTNRSPACNSCVHLLTIELILISEATALWRSTDVLLLLLLTNYWHYQHSRRKYYSCSHPHEIFQAAAKKTWWHTFV